jgi:hypothetical protein
MFSSSSKRFAYSAALSAALAACVALTPVQASASQLSGTEIKEVIGGKTVMLKTRWGGFPLRYANGGRVTGDGSALGLARFFAPKETGRWWVAGDQLCQQFPTWYDGRQFCFTLTRTGDTSLKWVREDGYSGTATVRG